MITRWYVTFSERRASEALRYLSCDLIEMVQGADGVWRETGAREALASFPAPPWSSPWYEGTQRHARAFAFAHPATVDWVTPRT